MVKRVKTLQGEKPIACVRKIIAIHVFEGYRLHLRFDDGTEREVDFSSKPRTGVFAFWSNCDNFRKAYIGDSGELIWNDEIDFCADALWRSSNLQIDPIATDC